MSTTNLKNNESSKNIQKSLLDNKASPTNVNDISHFFNQKNATPQTNIAWAQSLRGSLDHQAIQKKIESIPNAAPRVFDLSQGNQHYATQKKQLCTQDIDFNGNIAEFKPFVTNRPKYFSSKTQVDYASNLRDYKLNYQKQKKYSIDKETKSNFLKNDKLEEKIEKTMELKEKEKKWNSLPKIDKKEYFNFNIPKCQSIKDGIKINNQLKYAQYKDRAPSYRDLPKYSEDFGDRNSYNFIHFKNSTNSNLNWAFGLRYDKQKKRDSSQPQKPPFSLAF